MKPEGKRVTEKPIPVIVDSDYQHVMARAVIEETAEVRSPSTNKVVEEAEATITITAKGERAARLAEFVSFPDVIALSFVGVPVRTISKKEK